MPQNPSWRHHYVPRFLLEYWAVGDHGTLTQYGRKFDGTVSTRPRAPKAVGFEPHLYRLDLGPGVEIDIFETGFLKKVDDEASKVIALLHKGEAPITGGHMTILSRFISSLLQRDPVTVAAVKERVREDYERLVTAGRQKFADNAEDAAAFEGFLQGDGAYLVGQGALAVLRASIDNVVLGTSLNNMRWLLADLHGLDIPLVTSDRPLIVSDRGIGSSEGFAALALGPHLAAFGFTDARKAKALEAMSAERTVEYLNEQVVRQATASAFAIDDRHLVTIAPILGDRPIPSVQQRLGEALRVRRASDAMGRIEDDPRFTAELERMIQQSRAAQV